MSGVCRHRQCARWQEARGLCARHYRLTLQAGMRAALGGLLSPSLRPAGRTS